MNKHIKTQSKQALEIIKEKINLDSLLKPVEKEITDGRSFQICLDLNMQESIPDETAICRYRKMFARLGLDEKYSLLTKFSRS